MADEREPKASGACARLQSNDRTRREYLFSRKNFRDRWEEFSVCSSAHDRHDARSLRADDVERRTPAGARREKEWLGSLRAARHRTCRRSARLSILENHRTRIGPQCSKVTTSPNAGLPSRSPTSFFWCTTITR